MAQAFVITLREGLEMALIVVIVLAYLKRTGYTNLASRVWQGGRSGQRSQSSRGSHHVQPWQGDGRPSRAGL